MSKVLLTLAFALAFGCKLSPTPEPDRVGRVIIEGNDEVGDRVALRPVEVAPMPRPLVPEVGMTYQRVNELVGKPHSVFSSGLYGYRVSCEYSSCDVVFEEGRAIEVSFRSNLATLDPTPGNAFSQLKNNEFKSWAPSILVHVPFDSK
jgi:hypothetical protein